MEAKHAANTTNHVRLEAVTYIEDEARGLMHIVLGKLLVESHSYRMLVILTLEHLGGRTPTLLDRNKALAGCGDICVQGAQLGAGDQQRHRLGAKMKKMHAKVTFCVRVFGGEAHTVRGGWWWDGVKP